MKSVLSTRILTSAQQQLLLNASLGFTHYDAIKIEILKWELPQEEFDFLIFTSQNAVRSFMKNTQAFQRNALKNTFCVGEKTKILLEENGQKVIEFASNSVELAEIILKKYKKSSFLHITGNLRMDIIPQKLKENNVRYKEVLGYETKNNPKKFERQFDGIMFFSPSGVQSFIDENIISGTAFCIGDTTGKEARNYTENVVVAKKPSVENVIVQTVKTLLHD